MDSLEALSPCAGLLPLRIGGCEVVEADVGPIFAVSPRRNADETALTRALGLPFPEPGRSTESEGRRCVWSGHREALLMGFAPDAALCGLAAVVDQSDAWAVVELRGACGDQVLARLVPVDLRLQAFGVGATARTQLGHMNASITRVAENVLMIAVFRSMAATLVHDLTRALEAVAARG